MTPAVLELERSWLFRQLGPFGCQAGAGSWSWPPARLAREGTCARGAGLRAARMPRRRTAKASLIVFPAHTLLPPATAFPPLPARCPLGAALQVHTRPGTLPVTPAQPPHPGSLEGRGVTGPAQNWLLLSPSHRVLECPSWKGPGSSASPAPWCTGRRQAHKSVHPFLAWSRGCLRPTEPVQAQTEKGQRSPLADRQGRAQAAAWSTQRGQEILRAPQQREAQPRESGSAHQRRRGFLVAPL